MPIKATFTGDVTDLRRGTEQARQEFKKVGTEAEGAARQLKAVGSSFDGTRLEGAARRAATGIERIGGVARLTDSEVARNSRTITELLQKYERMGVEAPANIRRLAAELEQAAGSARKLDSATSGLGSSLKSGFGALAGGLGIGLGAGAGLAAISSIGGAIREAAAEAARLGPLSQAFERLQGGASKAQTALGEMRTATRGLVSDTDLMRSSNQASQLGLAAMGVNFTKLAQAATTLGRAVGNDATQSIDDLIGALGRGSTEVLDNLGVTLKMSEAHELYAQRIGKTVTQLTDQEKKQAFVTIGMERALEAANALGVQQLTVSEQLSRIGLGLGDLAVDLVSGADKSLTLADALGQVADSLERIRDAKPADVANQIATEMNKAAQEIETGIERWINSLPWYLRSIAETGVAPVRLANLAVGGATPGGVGEVPLPFAPVGRNPLEIVIPPESAPGATGLGPGGVTADLEAARVALGRLTTAQREAIKAAKELGQSNKEAAQAAGTSEEVVRLYLRQEAAAVKAAKAAAKLTDAQKDLNQEAERAFKTVKAIGPAETWAEYADSIEEATFRLAAWLETNRKANQGTITEATHPLSGVMPPGGGTPYFYQISGSRVTATPFTRAGQSITVAARATRDWADSFQDLSRALSQFSQISGGALDPITNAIGRFAATMDSARSLTRALGLSGSTGGGVSGALAAASMGWQVGMGAGSRGSAIAQGAASGAMAGAYSGAGAALGAAVGALSGYFGQRKAESEMRKLKDIQANQLLAEYGGLDEIMKIVSRTGMNQQTFLERFYGEPEEFAKGVGALTAAMTKERKEAEALAKSLSSVAAVQGVLSRQQLEQIRRLGVAGGPGAEAVAAFADQQRAQAESGLTGAVAALTANASLTEKEIADLTRGITDEAEQLRVVEAELARRATSTLQQFGMGAEAAAAGIFVAFSEAVRMGESAASVLARLQKPIQDLQTLYKRAGIQPGAGLQQLQVLSNIATGPQTGPAVQLATGLGQALAGFANTGMLSPELFGQLANGIGQAYKQLELFGQGGLEAARLMQPALQTIWQMTQDNPALVETLDDGTRALLDFAVQNGLVGDKFRPAIDRMLTALDLLITRIGDLIDTLDDIPDNTTTTITTEHQDVFLPPTGKPRPAPGLNYDGTPDTDNDPSTPMALGGIVTHPTRALIGEAGPEAVIPLSRAGLFSTPIQITVVSQIDGYDAARAITRYQPDVHRLYGTTRVA